MNPPPGMTWQDCFIAADQRARVLGVEVEHLKHILSLRDAEIQRLQEQINKLIDELIATTQT